MLLKKQKIKCKIWTNSETTYCVRSKTQYSRDVTFCLLGNESFVMHVHVYGKYRCWVSDAKFFIEKLFSMRFNVCMDFRGINHFLRSKTANVTGAHSAKSNFVTYSWSNDRVITPTPWISVLFLHICARSNFQLYRNT